MSATPLNPSPIDLICFDLGGVLVRTQGNWFDACKAAEVPIPKTLTDASVLAKLSELVRRSALGELTAEALIAQVADITGLTHDQIAAVSTAGLMGSFPGTADLISALKTANYRTACLSNTHDHHWRILTSDGDYNWMHQLDFRFASHLVGHAKPDQSAYAHVEQEAQVTPTHIAFFDDLPENVAAAQSRGWHAYHIMPASDPISQIRKHLQTLAVL